MTGQTMWRRAGALFVVAVMTLLSAEGPAEASYNTDNVNLSAEVSVQNTFHHNGTESIDWVQMRNEFKLGVKYRVIPRGKDFLFINDMSFSMLYRARYDAVYDIRETYRRRGYDRDDFRFPEGKMPREIFLDMDFFGGLSLRLGKQQLVWGEADLLRSLDIVNPLRLDQSGLIGEDFDDYREPLWMARFLYHVGQVGPVANVELEIFGSPNWRPLTHRALIGEAFRIGVDQSNDLGNHRNRRPAYVPFNQVRAPWEISRVGFDETDVAPLADLGSDPNTCNDGLNCADFVYLIDNQVPTAEFDFDRGLFGGARMIGQLFGLDFSLNYYYGRAEVPGTALRLDDLFDPEVATDGSPNPRADLIANAVAASLTPDTDGNGVPDGTDDLVSRCIDQQEPVYILGSIHGPNPKFDNQPNALTGCELVQLWYPRRHVIGATVTWNDFKYTGLVYRFEGSWSSKEPRNGHPPLSTKRAGVFPTQRDFDTHIKRDTQVWRGMIGFDYLRTPWPQPPKWFRKMRISTLLKDQWFFSAQYLHEYYANSSAQIGLLDSVTDRVQKHNGVFTYVMTGFFDHNKLRPWIAAGYDVNTQFPVLWLQAEYFFRKDISARIGSIHYLGSKFDEGHLPLNKYADRDNLFLRFTYFLI